jgi:hypothetical protein
VSRNIQDCGLVHDGSPEPITAMKTPNGKVREPPGYIRGVSRDLEVVVANPSGHVVILPAPRPELVGKPVQQPGIGVQITYSTVLNQNNIFAFSGTRQQDNGL